MTALEKDVLWVIAYFSYFGYPVTAFEIWKWQWRPERVHTLEEVMETLATSAFLSRRVQRKNGHYALGDIDDQLKIRHHHYLDAVEKYKKCRHVLRYLSKIPTIDGIALCNSLPMHFTRQESDIDLFIVCADGTLWSTRLMSVLPMILLRQRPGETTTSPVDASFYVARRAFNLRELTLPGDDPYFDMWVRSLTPVFERAPNVFGRFQRENSWAAQALPASGSVRRARAGSERFFGRFPRVVSESFARSISRARLPKHITSIANQDTRVVIREDVLKFHTTDRRVAIRDHVASCLENVS